MWHNNMDAQLSLNRYGITYDNLGFRLNSFNSNIGDKIITKDWEFSLSTEGQFGSNFTYNANNFAMGKRINDHYLYFNYSPGIQQKFIFSSGTKAIIEDSVQNFFTTLEYSEKYGFGYTYQIDDNFSLGFAFDYFEQNFIEEYPTFYQDSIQQIWQIKEENAAKNFWRGDLGISYSLSQNISLNLSSRNLLILKDFDKEDNTSSFKVRTNKFNLEQNKVIIAGASIYINPNLFLKGVAESTGSFSLGISKLFNFEKNNYTIGINLLHDKFQIPFLNGMLSSFNYSNELFSINLGYLKYFSDRRSSKTLSDFDKYRIASIENNYFSTDKLLLNLNVALSFKKKQLVKFEDLVITSELYPTFKENYINQPFATGKVINLSSKSVNIKPSSFIKEINKGEIYSPNIKIAPFDTAEVLFFTLFENETSIFNKTTISNAHFYLKTTDEEADDEIQKPILINDKNSWDGNVRNLRYYVKADLDFAKEYSSKIIKGQKNLLESYTYIKDFRIIELLYNSVIKNMTYVADRRASNDHVQFPSETIAIKGGDCDDLSVCFSAILESIGIQTAFIDYKPIKSIGHVTLLINTKLTPSQSELITINERKYFVRENINGEEEIWIPIEVTSLTDFGSSWTLGAERFYNEAVDNFGLSKSTVEIIDIY